MHNQNALAANKDGLEQLAQLATRSLRSLLAQQWRKALPPRMNGDGLNVTHAAIQQLCALLRVNPELQVFNDEYVRLGCVGQVRRDCSRCATDNVESYTSSIG